MMRWSWGEFPLKMKLLDRRSICFCNHVWLNPVILALSSFWRAERQGSHSEWQEPARGFCSFSSELSLSQIQVVLLTACLIIIQGRLDICHPATGDIISLLAISRCLWETEGLGCCTLEWRFLTVGPTEPAAHCPFLALHQLSGNRHACFLSSWWK